MEPRELVSALRARDALSVRQWLADAQRAKFDWSLVQPIANLDATDEAILAGVVELMAGRAGRAIPAWVAAVKPLEVPFFLVRAAESMPRLKRLCELEGPLAFRKRRLFAPPDFLTIV